ncbi:MAG: GlsB/YeaQ/YmgE family stress response membrane protein [Nitratireductor sp.]|nr:GlsB/YeaQ/YmgE family stress response membrane protein [Nitratireductor sp.]
MDAKALLVFLVIGIVAGFLASLIVGGGGGLIYYMVIGVIGAFVGGFLLNALGVKIGTGNAIVNQIITSAIGAIVVVILARLIT